MDVEQAMREKFGDFNVDVDLMRDVYMTGRQRVAYLRILGRALEFQEWRPISEAPRDSRARLVWVPLNLCIYLVSWREPYDEVDAATHPAGWYHFGGNGMLHAEPTLWRELPDAPAARGRKP